MIKLVFADAEELVRSGLRGMMASAPDIEVVGEASDGRSAVETARRLHPDVVCWTSRCGGPTTG